MFAYFPIKIVIWDHLGVIILHFQTHLGVFETRISQHQLSYLSYSHEQFWSPIFRNHAETSPLSPLSEMNRGTEDVFWVCSTPGSRDGIRMLGRPYCMPMSNMSFLCWEHMLVFVLLFVVDCTVCHPSNSFLWIPVGWNLCDRQPSEYASLVLAVVFSFREEGSCCSGTNPWVKL